MPRGGRVLGGFIAQPGKHTKLTRNVHNIDFTRAAIIKNSVWDSEMSVKHKNM